MRYRRKEFSKTKNILDLRNITNGLTLLLLCCNFVLWQVNFFFLLRFLQALLCCDFSFFNYCSLLFIQKIFHLFFISLFFGLTSLKMNLFNSLKHRFLNLIRWQNCHCEINSAFWTWLCKDVCLNMYVYFLKIMNCWFFS